MRLLAGRLVLAGVSLFFTGAFRASGAEVSFQYERAGVPVPRFTMLVQEDGSAIYEGEQAPDAAGHAPVGAAVAFHQVTALTPAMTRRIFALAAADKEFRNPCASHAKNVADTGTKTLSYKGPRGEGTCTYNFTENKNVTQLTEIFLGISETMDAGRRLEQLHRYDRLGLDAAITFLAEEVKEGRALELGTIAATLRSITADANVMQRVRLRASQLLSLLPPEMQSAAR